MLKHYLVTALRNLSRNRIFTTINIVGLSISIAIFLALTSYVTKASKGRGKVDYIATKSKLEKMYQLVCKPLIFNSVDDSGVDIGLNQFYYTVKKAGFIVNLYRMEGGAQKQVDVAIASHLVYHAMLGDYVVLSSGDIDFLPALQLVREAEPDTKIVLLTFAIGVHKELAAICNEHLLFEDHRDMMRI